MNNIQRVLIRLLDDFDRVCRENDIEYFLAGGTALGAIRHGGFLPWDDDIDILIKKDQFEKLDKIMSKLDLKDRIWTTEDNNETYLNPTARLFDTKSTDILVSRLDYGAPKGCQLEVFIMDPFPNDPEEQLSFMKHLWLYSEVTNPYILFGSLKMPSQILDPELYYHYLGQLDNKSISDLKKEIKEGFTYSDEQCDYLCGRWSCMPYVFKKEWMEKPWYVEFEGRTLPVPCGVFYEMVENYDMNWDYLPPKKSRKVHPSIKSDKVSYQELENDIRAWCDEVEYNKLLLENKRDRVERLFAQQDIQYRFSLIRKTFLSKLANSLNERSWKYDHAIKEDLNNSFEEFFLTFFKASYIRYYHEIELNNDLYEAMYYTLLADNRIENAKDLALTMKSSDLSDAFIKICDDINDLKIAKYEKNEARVNELLRELRNNKFLVNQIEIDRAYFWLLSVNSSKNSSFYMDELKKCENNEDLEILKYTADHLYKKRRTRVQAQKIYNSVLQRSNNGMILYDLKKKGVRSIDINDNMSVFKLKYLSK